MKLKRSNISFILSLTLLIFACQKPDNWEEQSNNDEWYSGGKQTVFIQGAGAYSSAFPFLSARNSMVHEIGDKAFEQTFVSGGLINPGLGPLYNSVSCTSCHIGDGRGTPIGPGPNIVSLLFKMSLAGQNPHGGPLDVPGFGTQLQHNAIFGTQPEAQINISYSTISGEFGDGSSYYLQQPNYSINNSYLPIPSGVMFSPRIAPPVFGLGLLEAVSDQTILEYEDEWDSNNDGISGKPNYGWDIKSQKKKLGRFGWKAAATSVLQQTAGAYNEDMGITNFLFPFENSEGTALNNDPIADPELSDSLLYAVAHYVSTLAVPARRNVDQPLIKRGKKIFFDIQCENCHRSEMRTATNVGFAEVSNQRIFPYSDMLLHDMGEGLADHRPDFDANGYEWRTPPLWGIGLSKTVNGHENFLHDGRARSLEEAIIWHGGEAENSKNQYLQLNANDRAALLAFLKSL